jgi:hypothetical protein
VPGNLNAAVVSPSSTVFPQSLALSFSEASSFPLLSVSYHDGTSERGLIEDGVNPPRPARVFTLPQRLTTSQLSTLKFFWEQTTLGGLKPFYFYNPFDVLIGQAIGSNYDSSGFNTQGRVTVVFQGNWSQRTDMGRHVVPQLTLLEIA